MNQVRHAIVRPSGGYVWWRFRIYVPRTWCRTWLCESREDAQLLLAEFREHVSRGDDPKLFTPRLSPATARARVGWSM